MQLTTFTAFNVDITMAMIDHSGHLLKERERNHTQTQLMVHSIQNE